MPPPPQFFMKTRLSFLGQDGELKPHIRQTLGIITGLLKSQFSPQDSRLFGEISSEPPCGAAGSGFLIQKAS